MAVRVMLFMVVLSALGSMAMASPRDILAQAKAALDAGDAEHASTLFDEIVARFPNSPEAPEAALRRGYLALRLKEASPGDHFLAITTQYADTSQAADALRRLGYLKQRAGDLEAAQDFFSRAASHARQTKSGKADALTNWAFLDISKYFAAGFPSRPKFNGKFTIPESKVAERTQRLDAARQKLNSVLNSIQSDEDLGSYASFVQCGIGETYILQERFAEAEGAYKSARDDFGDLPAPIKALAHHGLGLSVQRQCRFDEALVEEEAALDAVEEGGTFLGASCKLIKADAASQTALLLMGRQRYQEAVDLLTDTLTSLTAEGIPEGDLREAVATVAVWRALALHRVGRIADRNTALQEVLRTYPSTEAAGVVLKWSLKYGWG